MRHAIRTTRAAALATAGLLAWPAAAALAQRGPYDGYYGEHMMWGGGWFMGPVMMLVFLAVAVILVVLIVRWLMPGGWHGHHRLPPGRGRALEILEERFARGEIDAQEYEDKRRTLES